MTLDIIITLVSAVLIGVGCIGIIYPILPGSLAALAGVLLWGFTVRAPEGWWTIGLGGTLLVAGMSAQLLLTGRTLKRERIPNSSTLWGAVGAVIGIQSLGTLFTDGLRRNLPAEILVGIIATVILALLLDRALAWGGAVLTRWRKA